MTPIEANANLNPIDTSPEISTRVMMIANIYDYLLVSDLSQTSLVSRKIYALSFQLLRDRAVKYGFPSEYPSKSEAQDFLQKLSGVLIRMNKKWLFHANEIHYHYPPKLFFSIPVTSKKIDWERTWIHFKELTTERIEVLCYKVALSSLNDFMILHAALAKLLLLRPPTLAPPDDQQQELDWSLLHYSAIDDVQRVKALLSLKANPNSCDYYHSTPLLHSIHSGKGQSVQTLLENGADPNIGDFDGLTALELAARSHEPSLELLLSFQADIHARNYRGGTLLHIAVHGNNLNSVIGLLYRNANPNLTDYSGRTPLFVQTSNAEIAHSLLEARADPNAINNGYRPADLCVGRGHWKTLQQLLEANADPHLVNAEGLNLLHKAVITKDLNILEMLLERNADPNTVTQGNGDTPLHLAYAEGNKAAVELLLSYGADPNIRNQKGKLPEESTSTCSIQ